MYPRVRDYFYDLSNGDPLTVIGTVFAVAALFLLIWMIRRPAKPVINTDANPVTVRKLITLIEYVSNQRSTNLEEALVSLGAVVSEEEALFKEALPWNPLTRVNWHGKRFLYQVGRDVIKNNKKPAKKFDHLREKIVTRDNQILELKETVKRLETALGKTYTTIATYETRMGEIQVSKLDTIKRNSDLLETVVSQPGSPEEVLKVANAKNEGKVDIYEKFFTTAPATPARPNP